MSGSQYIALSGLRARADELDRVATDIANIGTAGYKGERESRAVAERPQFDAALQTAIDTTFGGKRLDSTDGAITTTGRSLDVAIDGKGLFVVNTAQGDRYTRNGHFTLDSDRRLVTEDGDPVLGKGGPITLGPGEVRIDSDGTVWSGETRAGQLSLVTVADPGLMEHDHGTLLSANGQTPSALDNVQVHGGSLEQSNVSVADRLAQLTSVSRGFEALQKAISMLMNDVDGKAIDNLGRR
ncbi:MAG: flagellar hook basal-body protein [Acidobacteriota bacterium]